MTGHEQFELVWKGSEISDDETLKQIAWAFWKASREAVEIELPSLKPSKSGDRYQWADGIYQLKIDVGNMIRAAGIKVKGE